MNSARREKRTIDQLLIVFCSESSMLKLNEEFLNHSDHTDVITFDYSEQDDKQPGINAEIFICPHRVLENAVKFKTTFKDELHRVIIHGLLHLCGYDDKTVKRKLEMTAREDFYLKLRTFI